MSNSLSILRPACAAPNRLPYAAWALLFAAIAVDRNPALQPLHFLPSAETIERFHRVLAHPVAVSLRGDRFASSIFPLPFASCLMAAIRCNGSYVCHSK